MLASYTGASGGTETESERGYFLHSNKIFLTLFYVSSSAL